MRIAFCHPNMDVKGGAENFAVWLLDELGRRGHEIALFTTSFAPEYWAEDLRRHFQIRLLPQVREPRFIHARQLLYRARALQLAKVADGVDLVVGHLYPSYVWAALARKLTGAAWRLAWLCEEPWRRFYPLITDAHLANYPAFTPPGVDNGHLRRASELRKRPGPFKRLRHALNRRWDKQAVRACDTVIANSAFTAGNVRAIFRVEAVPCHLGIPLPPEADYHSGEYVGVLTSLAIRKNVHNTIRAIRTLVIDRGRRDLSLQIAGAGRDRAELERMAADLGIAGHVGFLGKIPDEELPEFYRRARCVVYACIDEPFGLVPLEAMAAKTPVVVSDHGGPTEVVLDGITGLLANPFDPRSIADAIEALWTDEAAARRMGEAGRARVCEQFTIEAAADRFERLFSGLL